MFFQFKPARSRAFSAANMPRAPTDLSRGDSNSPDSLACTKHWPLADIPRMAAHQAALPSKLTATLLSSSQQR